MKKEAMRNCRLVDLMLVTSLEVKEISLKATDLQSHLSLFYIGPVVDDEKV